MKCKAKSRGTEWISAPTYVDYDVLDQAFFPTAPKNSRTKKLKNQEKTQNSSKKLKDSENCGVICCQIQRRGPRNKGETTKMPKSRMKFSKH